MWWSSPTNRPVSREDEDDTIYFNEEFKFAAITEEIVKAKKKGQPVLVGTVSIDKSEKLSSYLTRKGVQHEVLNAKNHAREALIIAEAGAEGSVTIATNMAGRGTDIKLGGNPEFRAGARPAPTPSPKCTSRSWSRSRNWSAPVPKRSNPWEACWSSAPSVTKAGASTTSCAAAPAARATRGARCSSSASTTS